MIAGSGDNSATAFKLLLANPNLVTEGVQTVNNSEDGRERARGLSSEYHEKSICRCEKVFKV